MNKENVAATPTFTRKRAKSFSTPPTTKPATSRISRGILKGNGGDDAHTIAFIPIHSPSKKTSESAEKRRKSLSRRVSFASHASVRVFEKAINSSPQTTPRRSNRLSPAKSPITDKLEDSPTRSPLAARFANNDDSNDELTMDLTSIIPKQTNPLTDALLNSDDDDESEDDFSNDEQAEDETSAMDLTDVLPVASSHASMSDVVLTPRQSRLPIRSKPSPKAQVYNDDNDETQLMDMTRVFNTEQPTSNAALQSLEDEINDDGMDMTRLVGGIISSAQARTSDNGFIASSPVKTPDNTDDGDDQTMNMDETRIFDINTIDRRQTLGTDEPTSHTSYTIATEEDDTQRLCEGSVTQADGFTQNMDITRALPTQIRTATRQSPIRQANVGFSWGANPVGEVSLMDVSMADVTQNDESVNMDMTQAIPTTFPGIYEDHSLPQEEADQDDTVNMDMTRVVASAATQLGLHSEVTLTQQSSLPLSRVSPAKTPIRQSPKKSNPSTPTAAVSTPKSASLKRRLSSGAIRTPKIALQSTSTPQKLEQARPTTPRRTPSIPRRKSLLESDIPAFGTPEAQVLLEPGSSKRPEFGSALLAGQDSRLSEMKEKIQSLTPRREVTRNSMDSPLKDRVSQTISPAKKARFTTPQKTPQRSLLAPSASVSRANSSLSMTPARAVIESPLPRTTLSEFLKMTGISFLTGLSTTRRRETIVMPEKVSESADPLDREIEHLVDQAYTVPMLEMYQHSCRELTRYITEGRAMCEEIESDMNDQNPELFDQYRRAGPAEKRDLEGKFKELKTTARLSAKGVWYVWRENLLSNVLVPLKKNLADLEKEAARLQEFEEKATPKFEQVQREYDELKAKVDELVREEDLYDSYDHEEAAKLAETIEAQEAQMAIDAAEIERLKAQDAQLDAELAAIDLEYDQKLAEVKHLEAQVEKHRGYSASEIQEMQLEYRRLVESTGVCVLHVTDSAIQLVMDDSLLVDLSLADLSVTLRLTESAADNVVQEYYITQLRQSLGEMAASSSPAAHNKIRHIRDRWTAVGRLMQELEAVESAHPLAVRVTEDDNLEATATVLLSASRTKFLVHLTSTPSLSLEDCALAVEVEVKYGGLDGAKVQRHVQARLHGQASQGRRTAGWLLESLRMPEGL
ncbi:Putative uncharacterized protein [Taphrina deformans PYCC 5710]|uniref:Spc7 kinetochore protein domain-containing protein n=1 Tax=Taphrina deformans (strain PYCC 5710 / ATCC 11124 / CBS 356.35 / IMI 108563 / JCM 9778 / NBRC 8474) TaxID=1097556 RepID=R4XA62_TAPDE|nr:Putative uncharacterized protein [Taphrina deformans PYCC 5710]|eukprot:CCG82407.1 Putative uncharacterized protein [Taphrina deformans PYCC 5710]